jgi:pyrimidine-nucleoside phosphorylase
VSFVEAIVAKRDGRSLSHRQVQEFVRGSSSGSVPPEQLAAMLMAICCRGMSADETRWLTEEMLYSGEQWQLGTDRPDAVDKHSTGGVGDTVSLILAPLLAAVGTPVAMMAGRGLGHSQGTLDKLDAIPGFDTDRDRAGMLGLLDQCGAAIVAQTDQIAPADRVLYAMRDVTGTVPSLPLIVASIMSKKLALGASTLVLDVKWGSGAFRQTRADAVELAAALREVARGMGMSCEALITDMNQPLGPALGTASEVRAALDILDGAGDSRLRGVTVELAAQALTMRGRQPGEARQELEHALATGAARRAWDRLVRAHGGNPDPQALPQPRDRVDVVSRRAGYVTAVAASTLGWAAVEIGAGRRRRDDELAFGAGLQVHARLGDRLEVGQPIATVELGEREVDVAAVTARVRAAIEVGDAPTETPQLVLGTVDQVQST